MSDTRENPESAILVQLTIRTWSGRANEPYTSHPANAALNAAIQNAKADHTRLTIPWTGPQTRLLPADRFLTYAANMRVHLATFDAAAASFAVAYEGLAKGHRTETAQEIARRFVWSVRLLPVPPYKAEPLAIQGGTPPRKENTA